MSTPGVWSVILWLALTPVVGMWLAVLLSCPDLGGLGFVWPSPAFFVVIKPVFRIAAVEVSSAINPIVHAGIVVAAIVCVFANGIFIVIVLT